jgi:hypothetical protein
MNKMNKAGRVALKAMMMEHHTKSLSEWLVATPHLNAECVEACFVETRRVLRGINPGILQLINEL